MNNTKRIGKKNKRKYFSASIKEINGFWINMILIYWLLTPKKKLKNLSKNLFSFSKT